MHKLDPKKYKKGEYKFDVKTWKKWGLEPNRSVKDYENEVGSFPMHELTLVGVISVIDPPKDAVPDAVIKCKTAGI